MAARRRKARVPEPVRYGSVVTPWGKLWLAASVRLVWLVWPDERQVDVWEQGNAQRTLGASEDLEGGDVLPGFRYSLANLWR